MMRYYNIAFLVLVTVLESLAWLRLAPSSRLRPNMVPQRTKQTNALILPLNSRTSLPRQCTYLSSCLENDDKMDLNLLLIDHYDSFTYNLVDYLSQLCKNPPLVLAADCADSWDDLLRSQAFRSSNWTKIDGVVLSPGPGNPDTAGKLSQDVIAKNPNLSILGVCLGHQIMGQVYGAKVECAPEPVHGQVRPIRILDPDDPLWNDIAGNSTKGQLVDVTRYHSLHVTGLRNDTGLIRTAVTAETKIDEEVVMSMRHNKYPHFGVQFHPESIGTPSGKKLLLSFCRICEKNNALTLPKHESTFSTLQSPVESDARTEVIMNQHEVFIHKASNRSRHVKPQNVMEKLIAGESDFTFWLDEAQACVGNQCTTTPAVSILGAGKDRMEYWGKEKPKSVQGLYIWRDKSDTPVRVLDQDILSYLQQQYNAPILEATMVSFDNNGQTLSLEKQTEEFLYDTLPFCFRGGHVGFLGYEVRHDTSCFLEEQEHGRHQINVDASKRTSDPHVPTAAFIWADRSLVYDHENGDLYLVGVASGSETSARDTLDWIKATSKKLLSIAIDSEINGSRHLLPKNGSVRSASSPAFRPNRSRNTYNRNFDQCIEHIRQGDSYELCLTNQLEASVPRSDPLGLYDILRKRNPAPFSAFLNWNSAQSSEYGTGAALAICCTSPERFVSVKRLAQSNEPVIKTSGGSTFQYKLQVEAKPIKGTCARVRPSRPDADELTESERARDLQLAQNLQSSAKNRAENLMIVDLLRNDLSRVCEPGSVHVAKLMSIESFATVHQMVSTIRGTLDPAKSYCALDVLKACFPGGSMTGAPKLRTMELLDGIEEGVARGPYSGCLGYISLNGSMDMNIIIRTVVLAPGRPGEWKVSVGAGGAITILSESKDEYEEMLLKATAVMQAVQEWATMSSSKKGSQTYSEHVKSSGPRKSDELDSTFV